MTEYAKIKRALFAKEMPDKLKAYFIILIQKHPALPKPDKDFICDFINNYETISNANRTEVLDVIDSLDFFISGGMSPII